MGIHHRGHAKFASELLNKLVNNHRGFGIKSGIGLVAKQVLRIQGNSTGNGHTLLHSSRQLCRVLSQGRLRNSDSVEAKSNAGIFFRQRHGREKIQRKTHVFFNREAGKKGRGLKNHSHFLAKDLARALGHSRPIPSVEKNLTGIWLDQTDDGFEQDRFAGSARTNNQVALPTLKLHVNTLEYLLVPEGLLYSPDFDHRLLKHYVSENVVE